MPSSYAPTLTEIFNAYGYTTQESQYALIRLLHRDSAFEHIYDAFISTQQDTQKTLKDAEKASSEKRIDHLKEAQKLFDKTNAAKKGTEVNKADILFEIPDPKTPLKNQDCNTILNGLVFDSWEHGHAWLNHFGQAMWFRGNHRFSPNLEQESCSEQDIKRFEALGMLQEYHSKPGAKQPSYDMAIQFGATQKAIEIRKKHMEDKAPKGGYKTTALLGSDRPLWPIHETSLPDILCDKLNKHIAEHNIKIPEKTLTPAFVNNIFYTFLAQALIAQKDFKGSIKQTSEISWKHTGKNSWNQQASWESEASNELSEHTLHRIEDLITKHSSPISAIKEFLKTDTTSVSAQTKSSELYIRLIESSDDAEFMQIVKEQSNLVQQFQHAVIRHFVDTYKMNLADWPRETDIAEYVFRQEGKTIPRFVYDVKKEEIISAPDTPITDGVFSVHAVTRPENGNTIANTNDTLHGLQAAVKHEKFRAHKKGEDTLTALAFSSAPYGPKQHQSVISILQPGQEHSRFSRVDTTAPKIQIDKPNRKTLLDALAGLIFTGFERVKSILCAKDKASSQDTNVKHAGSVARDATTVQEQSNTIASILSK